MIIDFHVHCFPDELAEKATAALQAKAGIRRYLHGTLGEIKASMRKGSIGHSVVLSIATKPQQAGKITEWSASIQDSGITAFGSVHPESASWAAELLDMKRAGLKGLKLHPEYQDFYVDDKRMYPIYSKAFELGFIIVFHAGADLGYPAPYHCTPERLKKVLRAFPGGKIVAAHMGGYKYWDGVERHLAGEDIYFDTSYSLDSMDREQFFRILDNHGSDRLLFATDSPWADQAEEALRIRGLGLPQKAEEAVLGGNAARLLDLRAQLK